MMEEFNILKKSIAFQDTVKYLLVHRKYNGNDI